MNALRRYLVLLTVLALVQLLAGCSDDSSGPTASESAGIPGLCEDDEDEPGDVDEDDEEDDDGEEDDDDCEDDD